MDEELRRRARQAAADGDPAALERLEASERRRRLLPRWNPLTRVRCELAFACPKPWGEMQVTEAQGVRFCDHCSKEVHEAPTAERFRELAKDGTCVSVPPHADYEVLVDGEVVERHTMVKGGPSQPDHVHLGGVAVPPPHLTGPPVSKSYLLLKLLVVLAVPAGGVYALGAWLGWWPWPAF